MARSEIQKETINKGKTIRRFKSTPPNTRQAKVAVKFGGCGINLLIINRKHNIPTHGNLFFMVYFVKQKYVKFAFLIIQRYLVCLHHIQTFC